MMKYAIGFLAGIADKFGCIRARNAILNSVMSNRQTKDGFDSACDFWSN